MGYKWILIVLIYISWLQGLALFHYFHVRFPLLWITLTVSLVHIFIKWFIGFAFYRYLLLAWGLLSFIYDPLFFLLLGKGSIFLSLMAYVLTSYLMAYRFLD